VWLRLVASLPVLAFLMLSGFLLRGDADAQQARRILQEMLDLLPLAGPALAQFLLGSDSGSLQVAFLQHAATATAIVWLVVVEHARRIWGGPRAWVLVVAGCGALALLVSPGLHDGQDPGAQGALVLPGAAGTAALVVLAGLAAAGRRRPAGLLLAWIPEARPRGLAARAKGGLLAVVALYLLLCLAVLFARGANWEPGARLARGPGDLRAGPVLST
jgi:hypothetical protein